MKNSTYLGTILTNKNDKDQRLEKKNFKCKVANYALLPLLKGQSVFRVEKITICKTLIRPVAPYGAESWTLNKTLLNSWLLFKEKF